MYVCLCRGGSAALERVGGATDGSDHLTRAESASVAGDSREEDALLQQQLVALAHRRGGG